MHEGATEVVIVSLAVVVSAETAAAAGMEGRVHRCPRLDYPDRGVLGVDDMAGSCEEVGFGRSWRQLALDQSKS